MKKLITFSLWGVSEKYTIGAIKNADLAQQFYPDWTCRFYVGQSVPEDIVKQLEEKPNTEVVMMDEPGDWRGMAWRFYPASEEDVDVFISRDCDSRLSEREAAAVAEWLASDFAVHSMSDHPHHFHPKLGLMGGMFGMKKGACPGLRTLVDQFFGRYPDQWQCDQDFLKDYIVPRVRDQIFTHSDIHMDCNNFPTQRNGLEFVGKIFMADESTVEDHEKILSWLLQSKGGE